MKTRRLFAGLSIAAALATTGTLLPVATAPAEAAGYSWGAIAWNYQGRTAYAVDYPSQSAARNKAKRLCGSRCGYFTFYNSCGAVAYKFTSRRTVVGTARGYASAAAAKSAARKKAGPGSRVRAWACTTR